MTSDDGKVGGQTGCLKGLTSEDYYNARVHYCTFHLIHVSSGSWTVIGFWYRELYVVLIQVLDSCCKGGYALIVCYITNNVFFISSNICRGHW